MNKDHTMLVDGDIVVYRCGFAAESTEYTLVDYETQVPLGVFNSAKEWKEFSKEKELSVITDPELDKEVLETDWTGTNVVLEKKRIVEPLSHALANVKSVMARILAEGGDHHVFLSQGQCFRHDVATIQEYKGNRKDTPRPVHYEAIREYLLQHYNTTVFCELEADDALAMAQRYDTVIASIDKDLLQVPGMHFNWVMAAQAENDEQLSAAKILITPEVGRKKLFLQLLTGDSTDNIPGVMGVGPVKARKILHDYLTSKCMWDKCHDIWTRYLNKSERFEEDGEGRYTYQSWRGDIETKTTEEIMTEVYHLLEVGGEYAKTIAESSGEALLLANITK